MTHVQAFLKDEQGITTKSSAKSQVRATVSDPFSI